MINDPSNNRWIVDYEYFAHYFTTQIVLQVAMVTKIVQMVLSDLHNYRWIEDYE